MYLCSKFTDCVANIISCKMFYKLYLIMSGLTFNFDLTDIIVLRRHFMLKLWLFLPPGSEPERTDEKKTVLLRK